MPGMSGKWDFFFLRVDDQPASIFVDLGIATEAPLPGHKHVGWVRVKMLRPRDDGFSSQEEFEDLSALEDDITARIITNGDAVYVGRVTSDGFRDFFFYAGDGRQFTRAAEAAAAHHPTYRCEVGGRSDPDWRVYFDFLSPSEDDRQCIANRGVREALEDHGDLLSLPRQIDHWAYFAARDGAAAFTVRIERDGFRHELPEATDEDDFVVRFSRDDRPDELDEVTIMLARLAREQGGEYDGWECPVVREAG